MLPDAKKKEITISACRPIGTARQRRINRASLINEEKLNYKVGSRRAGDIMAIYSDYSKAKNLLGWEPKLDVNDIMRSAWAWEKERTGRQNQ